MNDYITKMTSYVHFHFRYIFDSSFLQFLGLDGIVLWPFVFISTERNNTPPHILKHELVHVAQIRREGGPLCFYSKYAYSILKDWIKTGNLDEAYQENPYEKEAYEKENFPLTETELNEIRTFVL